VTRRGSRRTLRKKDLMQTPLTRPGANGAPSLAVPALEPGTTEHRPSASRRVIAAEAAAALGMLTGLWVAMSPWFIVLQHHGANATVTDLIAGLTAAGVGAIAVASRRGLPALQFGSLLLGAWLIIFPFVLDDKFPITRQMYWSNSWSGGVLMALALAGLAAMPRPVR
jgi:hypothetical protein